MLTFLRRQWQRPHTTVREIIGRSVLVGVDFWARLRVGKTVDETQTNYAFWDKFRRGKAKGFAFAGLFAKPIIEITASWVIGSGFDVKLADESESDAHAYTNDLLRRFIRRVRNRLQTMVIDLYGLGDQYIIVNPDGSLSIPSPDTVSVEYDALDYRQPVKFVVTSKLTKAVVTDEYREDGRTVLVKWVDRRPDTVLHFANLIGRIPVVHFANDRGGNETHGRPIYETAYRAFSRYDDLLEKMVDGAELMGNPIPTFEGMEDVAETEEAVSVPTGDTVLDSEGNEVEERKVAFDVLPALFIGKGGSFKFASPGNGFTDDIRKTLKSIWILIMEYVRIPEVIWGTELSSARATALEQMKTFQMAIEGQRLALEGEGADTELAVEARGGLLAVIDIWLRWRALTDKRVVYGPVTISWPDISERDEDIRLRWSESAHNRGVITDETFVEQSRLVDDAEAEVQKAKAQSASETDPFEAEDRDALTDDTPLLQPVEAA